MEEPLIPEGIVTLGAVILQPPRLPTYPTKSYTSSFLHSESILLLGRAIKDPWEIVCSDLQIFLQRSKYDRLSGYNGIREVMGDMMGKEDRAFRLLQIYERLNRGGVLEKNKLMDEFGISEKTARRDLEDLRTYIAEDRASGDGPSIVYDKSKNVYRLARFDREWMTNEEVLILCKILLESRALLKNELEQLVEKLLGQAIPDDRKFIRDMVKNEMFNYVQLRHGKNVIPRVWALSRLAHEHEIATFSYTRQDGKSGERRVKPVAVMFSEFYFYLVAYFADDSKDFPAVFRIDRIENINGTGKRFSIPYDKRFSDGEFRKRVQFMYPGELQKVTFQSKRDSLEAVLDRLPTAEIIGESDDGFFTVTAEAYGKGIDMWLRSQGDFINNVNSVTIKSK